MASTFVTQRDAMDAPARVRGSRRLVMRKESYITIPLDALIHACVRRLDNETDKLRFIDFARRLEELYRCRVANRTKRLRKSFQLFVGGSSDLGYSDDQLKREEDIFVECFHETLKGANFRLLSAGEYEDAMRSEYTLSLDLEMDTKKLDTDFIKRFLDARADDPHMAAIAKLNQSVLVYHRGAGSDTTSGLFVLEKVDYMFSWMFSILFFIANAMLIIIQPWKYKQVIKKAMRRRNPGRASVINIDAAAEPEQTHILMRQSLCDLLTADFFPNLLSTNTLEEPTFKEIVVLYRTKEQADKAVPGQPKSVNVKSFRDIPRADFEIILPAQAPQTRALDLFKLLLAAVLGITTISVKLMQLVEEETAEGNWKEETLSEKLADIMPLLLAVFSYMGKLLVQFRAQKMRYNDLMTRYLYDKTADSNDGVRTQLLESMLNQEIKEAVLAYFFLWRTDATSLRELDEEIEEFFRQLGDDIDFEVDDAVRKLVEDGFVTIDTDKLSMISTLRVNTISRAITRLEEHWNGYFDNPEQECPYCPHLDGVPHGM